MNASHEVLFIVRDQQLFRIRNGKEKLMCIAYPELVDILDEGSKSKTALSNLMGSKIPFAKFLGNQNDFDNFLTQSFNEYFSKITND